MLNTSRISLVCLSLCGLSLSGCIALTAADAALSVGVFAVKTTAKVAGAAIDLAIPDGDDDDDKDKKLVPATAAAPQKTSPQTQRQPQTIQPATPNLPPLSPSPYH